MDLHRLPAGIELFIDHADDRPGRHRDAVRVGRPNHHAHVPAGLVASGVRRHLDGQFPVGGSKLRRIRGLRLVAGSGEPNPVDLHVRDPLGTIPGGEPRAGLHDGRLEASAGHHEQVAIIRGLRVAASERDLYLLADGERRPAEVISSFQPGRVLDIDRVHGIDPCHGADSAAAFIVIRRQDAIGVGSALHREFGRIGPVGIREDRALSQVHFPIVVLVDGDRALGDEVVGGVDLPAGGDVFRDPQHDRRAHPGRPRRVDLLDRGLGRSETFEGDVVDGSGDVQIMAVD